MPQVSRFPWESREEPTPEPQPRTIPNAAPTADAIRKYAQRALDEEIKDLLNAPERNNQLFLSAANLFELVSAGALTEEEVTEALRNACLANRYIQDDGEKAFDNTLASGRDKGLSQPRDLSKVNGAARNTPGFIEVTVNGYDAASDEPAPRPTGLEAVWDAEDDFWKARDSLTQIFDAALSRMCSPWAVLAHCAARALMLVRPNVTLPPLIGGPGSLNWFAAIAAPSGGGKGAASAVARELVPEFVHTRNLGSGEGMTSAFYRPGSKNVPPDVHEAVLFLADEIDSVSALGSRTGATLMSTIRAAFSGETLGNSYRGDDTHIEAGTYRMVLAISIQPARAGGLMGDHGGGTPQRFQWFPGIDPRITDEPDGAPWPLNLPRFDGYPQELTIPDEARRLILSERAKSARGEAQALDGHAMFCREKFAYSLAILDGRKDMTSEDWRLSGIASEVSSRTRDWVQAELRRAEHQEATEVGRVKGVQAAAAEDEKGYQATRKQQRIGRWILARLDEGPMTQRELDRACAHRDRGWLTGALNALQANGLIGLDGDKKWSKL